MYTIGLVLMLSFVRIIVSTVYSVTAALMESAEGSDNTIFSASIWMPAFISALLKRRGYMMDIPAYPHCGTHEAAKPNTVSACLFDS